MSKHGHAAIRLVIQVILAILQSLAAFGLFAYLLAVEPSFDPGGDAMLLFLIAIVLFAFVHAAYRIIDGTLTWKDAKHTNSD